ncbi:citrate/2-methylcitrate synthase [Pannonibacter sp.]|uniref:citrate synthase n=1 Tax=Pannonibacter sp. TaxID=1906786 RepID=UPI003F6FBD2E
MTTPLYLSAREAAAELGVQPATLYAYVSRGLIRSVPGPGKQKRYDASDIRGLAAQRDRPEPVATTSLTGGAVLETRLTLIAEDGPWYRGHSALDLAESFTLEAVAGLLWACDSDPFATPPPPALPVPPDGCAPLERLMLALAAYPLIDPAAYTRAPALLPVKGAALLRIGVAALAGLPVPSAEPLHRQLALAFGVATEAGADLVRAALILSADHELNTSAFAVRCAASTRAPLHAALLSGVGAFSGPRHGAASDRVAAWLAEIRDPVDIAPVLQQRLQRGDPLPGFGHMVYRGEDPRATCLLARARRALPDNPVLELAPALIARAAELFGAAPNIDFALALVVRALGLPPDAAKILFCAGRIVGWIGHALEQIAVPEQIRPRATYVGERPRRGK